MTAIHAFPAAETNDHDDALAQTHAIAVRFAPNPAPNPAPRALKLISAYREPIFHEPVRYSTWAVALACFHMGWTVLKAGGRHWLHMLMLRIICGVLRAWRGLCDAVYRKLHSLTFAWSVAGCCAGLAIISIGVSAVVLTWR